MTPLSILAPQKVAGLFTANDALNQEINALTTASQISLPSIAAGQVLLSSAGPEINDGKLALTYPRISLYTDKIKNTQEEKFRSFSGVVLVVAEIWASSNLVNQADQWIHFYVEAATNLLRRSIGDWGDGTFFGGAYEVNYQAPKAGGLGFVEQAKLTCSLHVSRS